MPSDPNPVRQYLLALSFLGICLASGCGNKSEPQPTGPKPKAVLDEWQTDFGKVVVGQKVSHTFTIRNEGDADLILDEPRKLGASTPYDIEYSISKRTIPPGETATVNVTIQPNGVTFKLYAGLHIPTNEGENMLLRMGGRLVVEDLVELRPLDLAQDHWKLTTGPDGRPQEFRGTLHSAKLPTFRVVSINNDPTSLKAVTAPLNAEELKSLGAKSGYAIRVFVDGMTTVGRFSGKLTFQTDVKDGLSKSVRVEGLRLDPIRFVTARGATWNRLRAHVKLGAFAAKDGKTATVDLHLRRPKSGAEVTWQPPECSSDLLKVGVQRGPMSENPSLDVLRLTLTIPPGKPAFVWNDRFPCHFTLRTNHPDAKTIRFDIHAQSN